MDDPKQKDRNDQGLAESSERKEASVAQQPQVLEFVDYVTVFETRNLALISIAKSLLKNVGIRFNSKNEGPQTAYSGGFVQIQVAKQDEARARELLVDLE